MLQYNLLSLLIWAYHETMGKFSCDVLQTQIVTAKMQLTAKHKNDYLIAFETAPRKQLSNNSDNQGVKTSDKILAE